MEDSLTPLMENVARQIEEEISREGWDQPASLWSVRALGGDRYAVAREFVMTKHPAEALVGVRLRDADGCAIVTEGWTYSEKKMSLLRLGRELKQPSSYPDRVEVRHVYLVLEGGHELLVQRVKGQDAEVTLVGDDTVVRGRIVAAARRVMGLPSGVIVDAGTASMRERALLAGVLDALEGLRSDGASTQAALGVVARSCHQVRNIVDVMGLNAATWDEALWAATAAGGLDVAVREFLAWADGPMWGERLEDAFEIAALTRERLERLARNDQEALGVIYQQLGLE